ncbi:hypothetical protein HBI81_030360 [Parastagonospora nodorum]|nr:hypothetical protein HBI72_112400 [Parastagonospora nodorum]KAH5360885.1 hypothetical protein HBI48_096220 [Parastagonospora nodorum]KAH5995450.1 hypothetical protein HBI84_133300 [Parastagonospora nodorum]KAH6222001.1 hypothetical protein HBI43_095540 [Parastagonospora nodorum]KAH6263094.1 hypothetical protein HBI42_073110 [Parastagonospora nodorum]
MTRVLERLLSKKPEEEVAVVTITDSPDISLLFLTTARGHNDTRRSLLDKCAGVRAPNPHKTFCEALCTASKLGLVDIAQTLLEHGSAVSITSQEYDRAVEEAKAGGFVRVVICLLDRRMTVIA